MSSLSMIDFKPEMPIEYLKLPERAYNALLRANILTIRGLTVEMHQETLTSIKGIGIKMASEIVRRLEESGYGKNFNIIKKCSVEHGTRPS